MAVHSVDVITAKAWLDAKEAVIIDVREKHEYDTLRIDGAMLVALGNIDLSAIPSCQHRCKIILQCRIGKRSIGACNKLFVQDASLELYNLQGGIEAWVAAGLPVIYGSPS